MRTRAIRTTIAVIGEGPTEKYYLKSLEGIIHAQVKPMIPNHATSMLELERRIEQCIDDGYNMIFCLLTWITKKKDEIERIFKAENKISSKNDYKKATRYRKFSAFF